MNGRDKRQERRWRRRAHKHQSAPVVAAALPPLSGHTRRGLVHRYIGRLVARRITTALNHPAAAPLTALAVGVVVAAVALGLILGALIFAAGDE